MPAPAVLGSPRTRHLRRITEAGVGRRLVSEGDCCRSGTLPMLTRGAESLKTEIRPPRRKTTRSPEIFPNLWMGMSSRPHTKSVTRRLNAVARAVRNQRVS